MIKFIKKNILNTITKKGLRLKAFKFISQILYLLKKKKKKKPFFFISKIFLRLMPVSITKSMKRGKHDIFFLLPISLRYSFHLAGVTLAKNSKIKRRKKATLCQNYVRELEQTLFKRSKSYQLRLKNINDVKFVSSFNK